MPDTMNHSELVVQLILALLQHVTPDMQVPNIQVDDETQDTKCEPILQAPNNRSTTRRRKPIVNPHCRCPTCRSTTRRRKPLVNPSCMTTGMTK